MVGHHYIPPLKGKERRGRGRDIYLFSNGPGIDGGCFECCFFDLVGGKKEQVCKRNVGLGWGGRETARK